MFSAAWTPRARADYEKLKGAAEKALATRRRSGKQKASKQEGLFKQGHKAIQLLLVNPRHPSLQTHAYDSLEHPYNESEKVFEAYAQQDTPGAYRIFWCYGPGKRQITLIAIAPHP
jgi:hypothetical protein